MNEYKGSEKDPDRIKLWAQASKLAEKLGWNIYKDKYNPMILVIAPKNSLGPGYEELA